MSKVVFISFRFEDNEDGVYRLYEKLADKYGAPNVFHAENSINPASDYENVMQEEAAQAEVLLVMIGENWQVDRLTEQSDPVRLELERAIEAGVKILPVLMGDRARMPAKSQLPPSLECISTRNATKLARGKAFSRDALKVIDHIDFLRNERTAEASARPATVPPPPPTPSAYRIHVHGKPESQRDYRFDEVVTFIEGTAEEVHVWTEGWEGWKPWGEVPELVHALRVSKAPDLVPAVQPRGRGSAEDDALDFLRRLDEERTPPVADPMLPEPMGNGRTQKAPMSQVNEPRPQKDPTTRQVLAEKIEALGARWATEVAAHISYLVIDPICQQYIAYEQLEDPSPEELVGTLASRQMFSGLRENRERVKSIVEEYVEDLECAEPFKPEIRRQMKNVVKRILKRPRDVVDRVECLDVVGQALVNAGESQGSGTGAFLSGLFLGGVGGALAGPLGAVAGGAIAGLLNGSDDEELIRIAQDWDGQVDEVVQAIWRWQKSAEEQLRGFFAEVVAAAAKEVRVSDRSPRLWGQVYDQLQEDIEMLSGEADAVHARHDFTLKQGSNICARCNLSYPADMVFCDACEVSL